MLDFESEKIILIILNREFFSAVVFMLFNPKLELFENFPIFGVTILLLSTGIGRKKYSQIT
eukprot:snap_masked-scaffold_23-processed-gene-4.25-mRNA-1 protein AED:1.00 eAED:1.00 QI:0/-1/0/0/-1/1/1/0/60